MIILFRVFFFKKTMIAGIVYVLFLTSFCFARDIEVEFIDRFEVVKSGSKTITEIEAVFGAELIECKQSGLFPNSGQISNKYPKIYVLEFFVKEGESENQESEFYRIQFGSDNSGENLQPILSMKYRRDGDRLIPIEWLYFCGVSKVWITYQPKKSTPVNLNQGIRPMVSSPPVYKWAPE